MQKKPIFELFNFSQFKIWLKNAQNYNRKDLYQIEIDEKKITHKMFKIEKKNLC